MTVTPERLAEILRIHELISNKSQAEYDTIEALRELDRLRAQAEDVARLVEAANEVWDSIPSTFDEDDPTVIRHAMALRNLKTNLAPFVKDNE